VAVADLGITLKVALEVVHTRWENLASSFPGRFEVPLRGVLGWGLQLGGGGAPCHTSEEAPRVRPKASLGVVKTFVSQQWCRGVYVGGETPPISDWL
jgi:hypothetical protein